MQQAQKQMDMQDIRRARREEFMTSLGWPSATLQALPADASFRRYYRIGGAGKPLLLMEDPPELPTFKAETFAAIAAHLRTLGLRAPEVLHQNLAHGLLVIEDFGDDTYTRLFEKGADPVPLYELAVDTLVQLNTHPRRSEIDLPPYDDAVLVSEAMLLLDWYYPKLTGQQPTPEMKKSYADVWTGLFRKFPKDQKTLVLRDYHVDNIMLVGDEAGLLDFQDGLIGPLSYDLMSLLEDARRDVPEDLQEDLYDRYLAAMPEDFDLDGFDYSYRVLAAQRHAKVLGIFVRLSVRDGKDRYLHFLPHVKKLFLKALDAPELEPLAHWFEDNNIEIGA